MTLVAAFGTPYAALMVADSRLVHVRNGTLTSRRDVCQKVFPLSRQLLVAFSNGALSAVRLVRKLATSKHVKDPEWLLAPDRAVQILKALYERAEVTKLDGPQVQLLFALHRLEASQGSDVVVPRVALVCVDCDPCSHRVVADDLEVIGAATDIRDTAVEEDSVAKLAKLAPYDERGLALRALFAHLFVCDLMREKSEPTIGGLYQVYYLGSDGPTAVPYDTWGEISPELGTPVSMSIQSGGWVQEHKPTRLRVRVRNPLKDEQIIRGTSGSDVFAVREFLWAGAPGVRRAARRVRWHAALHPDVYRYEQSTGGFTKKIILPPVDSAERSAFAQLIQPLFEIGTLQDWVERPDRYFGRPQP